MKVTVKVKESFIPVPIVTEFIKLEAALKLCNAVSSGGEGKAVILDGQVIVNGETCLMRGKKLYNGDSFAYLGQSYQIVK